MTLQEKSNTKPKKVGRPVKVANAMLVTLRLSPDDVAFIDALKESSRSEAIRRLIREARDR